MENVAPILTAIASIISAIGVVVAIFKVNQVHKLTNSMKDELVASTKVASKAEGKQEEREEARARNNP